MALTAVQSGIIYCNIHNKNNALLTDLRESPCTWVESRVQGTWDWIGNNNYNPLSNLGAVRVQI